MIYNRNVSCRKINVLTKGTKQVLSRWRDFMCAWYE